MAKRAAKKPTGKKPVKKSAKGVKPTGSTPARFKKSAGKARVPKRKAASKSFAPKKAASKAKIKKAPTQKARLVGKSATKKQSVGKPGQRTKNKQPVQSKRAGAKRPIAKLVNRRSKKPLAKETAVAGRKLKTHQSKPTKAVAAAKSLKTKSVVESVSPKMHAPEKGLVNPVAGKKTPASKVPGPAVEMKLPAKPVLPTNGHTPIQRATAIIPGSRETTVFKPPKNQAGLRQRELDHFTQQLLAKRREIVGDMSSMEREALRSGSASNLSTLPIHMADMGTDNYEQEFTLGLVEKDRTLLREINHALAKIQTGTYGICEGTGIPISRERLEFQPWARYSIEYARQKEKNGMGVRQF